MSSDTKKLMGESLKKFLQTRPVTKITIQEIADDCGISRMTFYYHFQDIYKLLTWMLEEQIAPALSGKIRGKGWQEEFYLFLKSLSDNQTIVDNIYIYIDKDRVYRYLSESIDRFVQRAVAAQTQGMKVTDEEIQFYCRYHTNAFVSLTFDWISRGMKESPEYLLSMLEPTVSGSAKNAMANFEKRRLTAKKS